MTTNEARTCEACGGFGYRPWDCGSGCLKEHAVVAEAWLCKPCFDIRCSGTGAMDCLRDQILENRNRRSRSRPAQLEARGDDGVLLRVGDRVEYTIDNRTSRGVITEIHQPAKPDSRGNPLYDLRVLYDCGTECDAIAGAFVKSALRDTPASRPPTSPAAAEVANPLKGLAEAFRELARPLQCCTCGSIVPAWRFADLHDCVYCKQNETVQTGDGDMGRICEWPKGFGIDRIASVAPAEAGRAPWDWYVSDDAPDGCA